MTTAPIYRQPEPWTVDDLDRLPEAHYEILDGTLLVTPSPTPLHQVATGRLYMLLDAAATASMLVVLATAVSLDKVNYVEPDLAVVHMDAFRVRPKQFMADDLLLAVEVVSPSSTSRDRLIKPAKYAEAKIPHYWRVELDDGPDTPFIVRYELDGGVYREVDTIHADEEAVVQQPFPVTLRPADLIPF